MTSKAALLIILIMIPVVAWSVARSIQKKFEVEWKSALSRELSDKAPIPADYPTLRSVCADPTESKSLGQSCIIYNSALIMSRSSWVSAGLGVLLFGSITIGGYLARSNRKVLLILFRPGLYLTVFMLVVLVLLHASLAMGAVYLAASVYGGDVSIYFIVPFIGFGAVFGGIAMIRGTISVFRPTSTSVLGKRLSVAKQPNFHKFVTELSREIGALTPDHIVVGLDPNFFVTEGKLGCRSGILTGRTMYLSLPLCRIMTQDELRAVIGHELGHYKGLDTEFSQKFYPIYRGATESLAELARELEGVKGIALWPAYHCLSLFLESFALAESKISRERELAADRIGADFAGASNLGMALIKVHAFSDYWGWLRQSMRQALAENRPYKNASIVFAEEVKNKSKESFFEGLDDQQVPHPTNTHPPLRVRLEALGLQTSALINADLLALPESPAIGLILNHEQIEEELTASEQKSMVQLGEVRTVKTCPACATLNPVAADRCQCGFNFLRLGIR